MFMFHHRAGLGVLCRTVTSVLRVRGSDSRAERVVSRRLLKNCCKLIAIQRQESQRGAGLCPDLEAAGHAGGKHPYRASSWKLPEMRTMVRLCGSERFVVHGCMHGLKNPKNGRKWQKPCGWFSSLPEMRHALEMPCNDAREEHEPIQGGRNTAMTAACPGPLCRKFAKVLLKSIYQGEEKSKEVRTPCRSSKVLASSSEEAANVQDESCRTQMHPEAGNLAPQEPQGEYPGDPQDMEDSERDPGFVWDPEVKRKLTLVHRNLGHPNKQAPLKLLKDAGATEHVLQQAKHFECAECKARGRRAPTRPSIAPV